MRLEELVPTLNKPKRQSDGSFLACCPSHADAKQSLHVSQKEGKILLKCFAGCTTESICQSIGINIGALFGERMEEPKQSRKIVATYTYYDMDGTELYQVVRFSPKSFQQRHKNGNEYVYNMDGIKRVLYHLPDVVVADEVYVVEGEKDADNLTIWGKIATTSVGGASSWKPEYAESLRGRKVIIIPDNDTPGINYARNVAKSLEGISTVKVILLPKGIKDISDWLDAGNDIQQLDQMQQDVDCLVETVDLVETVNIVETVGLEENVEKEGIVISTNEQKPYKLVATRIANWLSLHEGETFDLDLICRQCGISDANSRNYATIELSKKVKAKKLEKFGRTYTIVSTLVKYIDWTNASDAETLNVTWPSGREDGSIFDFSPHVITSPGDIVVIAGGSNFGKTTFVLNFLWDNMGAYPCTLMGNEYAPGKFKRRVKNMLWADPLKEDGTPKFELIERRERWQDIIRPDNINIIDWINLGDNFYQIGKIIEGIQAKLRGGMAVVVLQKSEGKELGLGGGFSEHLASLYLSIDYKRLTVVKCKEFIGGYNPNRRTYGFNIIDAGTKFDNIREMAKCKRCYPPGKYKGGECEVCSGTGWINKEIL